MEQTKWRAVRVCVHKGRPITNKKFYTEATQTHVLKYFFQRKNYTTEEIFHISRRDTVINKSINIVSNKHKNNIMANNTIGKRSHFPTYRLLLSHNNR